MNQANQTYTMVFFELLRLRPFCLARQSRWLERVSLSAMMRVAS